MSVVENYLTYLHETNWIKKLGSKVEDPNIAYHVKEYMKALKDAWGYRPGHRYNLRDPHANKIVRKDLLRAAKARKKMIMDKIKSKTQGGE